MDKRNFLVFIISLAVLLLFSLSVVSAVDFADVQDDIDSGYTNINLGNDTYMPRTIDSINVNKNNVIIKGQSVNSKAVLDASSSSSRIMRITGNNVRLENLIFRNVDAKVFGGGISSNGANLTIINCDFINNKASVGAIFLDNSSTNVLIQNCTFIGNMALYSNSNGGGGGINSHSSNGRIINCTFINNSAITGGGALYFIFGTNNLVSGCDFINNSAPIGGAIWTGTRGTTLKIESSYFTNNKATNNGGSIYSTNILNVTFSNFTNNSAKNNGGSIFNTGTLNLMSSLFANNTANSRLTVSIPTYVNCSNIATIKVTLIVGNNIKDAIYSSNNIIFDGTTIIPKAKIPNQNIVLTINSKTFNNKTNNNGIATFNLNTLGFTIIKHNGNVKYLGNNSYSQSSNNFILNVVTKKITTSVLKNIKTYKTKIQYQARISIYSNMKVNYKIYYWKPIKGNMIQYYKTKKGVKTVSVFKNYSWKNISKGSSAYKWYRQRYFKIYYTQANNNTKIWINGKLNKTTNTIKKYNLNGTSKYVKGKSKDLSRYVLPSTDCESNNPSIKALAKKLTKGKKTDRNKANAILKYVQKYIKYRNYGNTHNGAFKTYKSKVGNCVDSTHLTIALLRAANIPAKYEAKYVNSNIGGHCWPLVYLKVGKKYKWIGGEATENNYVAFGKHTGTKKWQSYKSNAKNYINSYKYSKKYVYQNDIKKWAAITEYQYINGKWITHYVISGNADRTYTTIVNC